MSDNPHGLVLPPELNPRGVPQRRRRRGVRILSWIAVITSVAVLVTSGVGFALFKYYDGNINRLPGLFRSDDERPSKGSGRATNFLLVGSDSREGATKEDLHKFSTQFEPGRRSDTMILIHLSAKRDKATLVSFPRDAYVEIPGRGRGKINTAFARGGPPLAIATVEKLTNVRIDHYIEVNFAGFLRMVDALGHVEVCLQKPARDRLSGIDLPAGVSKVSGAQALAFVRQREGLPGGDLGRIERQQQFLGAMLRRATSAGILLRPDRLLKFLKVVTDSVQVDDRLTFDDMKDLAFALKDLDPAKVQFVTVPVDRLARRQGQSVVLLDEVAAGLLFEQIRNDVPIGGERAAEPAGRLTVPPSRVRVTVLNATDTKGLAADVASKLRAVGFRTIGTGNASSADAERTVVRYGSNRADSARTLQAAVPGARLERVDGPADRLELVVGRNFETVRKVEVSPATRAPQQAGTPPPTKTAADDPCA